MPSNPRRLLVTGGAGFIGTNFILNMLAGDVERVVNLDRLTYAGNLDNLRTTKGDSRYLFCHGDICDRSLVSRLLEEHAPDALLNFAAESHVDRSIDGPTEFVRTNVVGTFELLEATRLYLRTLPENSAKQFRFLHVSTDEVFGSLEAPHLFTEQTPYAPNSPYAASKAGGDHLVRAYFQTYALPVMTTHCSNNFGPYQFPEKLVPLMILNALEGKSLPVYGDGLNVRDWIFVSDHCAALRDVLTFGVPGSTYNVGARNERTNLEIVRLLCRLLDEILPPTSNPRTSHRSIRSYSDLIGSVTDRRGHDRRYALDPKKIEGDLGWRPKHSFEEALKRTIHWYLDNVDWCERITSGVYARERLGLG